jgi:hypothetical protein
LKPFKWEKKMFRLALLGLALVSAPAYASPHYHADPQAQPARERVVTRDGARNCGADGCTAAQGNSRPEIACAALVRQVGALNSFSANGSTFAGEQLEKCNTRAR